MRRLALPSLLFLLLAAIPAAAAKADPTAAASSPEGVSVFVVGGGREPSGREKRIRARVRAVAPFVPGQPAMIAVRRMPKHAYMFVSVTPIQSTPACANLLCVPTFVVPDENDPSPSLARASGRGRALVTFTMPTGFQAYSPLPSGKLPKRPQLFPWNESQAVQVVVAGAKQNRRGDEIIGIAGTKTVVHLQPTSAP